MYDYNNTGYYLDPNGSSLLNIVFYNGYLYRQDHAVGYFVGSYNNVGPNDAKSNPIYAIGSSYIPTNTSLSNMYGIGYSHPNFWGGGKGGGWGLYVASNGTIKGTFGCEGDPNTWISGYGLSDSSWRAPIFYDSNNTAYYIDPASGTNLAGQITQTGPGRTSSVGPSDYDTRLGSSDLWFWFKSIAGAGSSGYPGAIQFGRNDSVFVWPIVLNPRGGNVGINSYSADYTLHVAGTGYASSDFRAPIFYDSGNTGYSLNGDVSSAWRLSTPSGYLDIGPMNGSFCHFQTDRGNFYFAQQAQFDNNVIDYSGNWALYDGYGIHNGSWRAPIFYDSNDTGYYCDPNSSSRLNTATFGNGAYTDIILLDDESPNGRKYIHANSNLVGFLSGGGSWISYTDNSGNFWATASSRSPIFYDNNDTGYYTDPASTSYINGLNVGGQTWRGDITWNASVNINVNGESSIDVYGGNFQVWDIGSGTYMINCPYQGQVAIGNAGSRGLYVYGAITATSNITAYSDVRIKRDINTVEDALGKILAMRGVTYYRIDDKVKESDRDRRKVGVVAQEIENILPEVVYEDEKGFKSVDYGSVVGVLIEAIKELKSELDEVKSRIH
jgi:hypothetical protein